MRNILITGRNSYIGKNVEMWLKKESQEYLVDTVCTKTDGWKTIDFERYDVIFHVAGIAHVSYKSDNKDLYQKVNRDLAIEVAKKAKEAGVRQFIFMSSMIVFGSLESKITIDSIPNPDTYYGKSKLEAEKGLHSLSSNGFRVCILRPPMIYGEKSLGNFGKLRKLSELLLFFPRVDNLRSMIYIENFCEFVKKSIEQDLEGIYHVQNTEIVGTDRIVSSIRNINKKNTILFSGVKGLLLFFSRYNSCFNKMFTDYYYDPVLTNHNFEYNVVDFVKSIEKSISQ